METYLRWRVCWLCLRRHVWLNGEPKEQLAERQVERRRDVDVTVKAAGCHDTMLATTNKVSTFKCMEG